MWELLEAIGLGGLSQQNQSAGRSGLTGRAQNQALISGLGQAAGIGMANQSGLTSAALMRQQQAALANQPLIPEIWQQEMLTRMYQMQRNIWPDPSTPTWHDFSCTGPTRDD